MQELLAAVRDFEVEDDDFIDARALSSVVDRLQAKLCRVVAAATRRGDHLLAGKSACSWVAAECQMSKTSAADRLCVGQQLAQLPRVAEALSSGEIGYQATSVICHLSDQVGEKRQYIDQEDWVGFARRFSIKELRYLAHEARVQWDCEGFERESEEYFELRSLHLSETTSGMYRLDAWLDPAGGAALKAAIESLSRPLGGDDVRTPRQRRADALVEIAHHAMDQGSLPKRNGARPHISVQTTIAGLKGELGAQASHLQSGMPISNKTVQRLACDGTLHRVLKADSMVVDVGRAKRTAQPAQGSPRSHGAGTPAGRPQDLRRPWLRPADQLDLRPPPRFLGGRRAYQPAQDAAALLPPPPPRARRRVAGHPRGRPRRIRPPGYSGVQPAAMGRETVGGLRMEAWPSSISNPRTSTPTIAPPSSARRSTHRSGCPTNGSIARPARRSDA